MTNGVLECFRCHTPIPGNSKFCLSCGADVSGGDGPTSTSSVDIVRERLQRIIEGIYRVESEGGLNYFVMKYISGTSLEDLLDKKEPLPVPEIQRILWEAACALGHAHQRGVVHRDVKPANIMFDHDGRVMLTDFGISKALQ